MPATPTAAQIIEDSELAERLSIDPDRPVAEVLRILRGHVTLREDTVEEATDADDRRKWRAELKEAKALIKALEKIG